VLALVALLLLGLNVPTTSVTNWYTVVKGLKAIWTSVDAAYQTYAEGVLDQSLVMIISFLLE